MLFTDALQSRLWTVLFNHTLCFFHFLPDSGMFCFYFCNAIMYILQHNAHCQIIAPHYSELATYEESLLNKHSNPQIQNTLL